MVGKVAKEFDLSTVVTKLPVGKSPDEEKRRRSLFEDMDVSNNGSLSLSEIDLGIKCYVGEEVFLMKKAIKMAYKVARNSDPDENAFDAEFVQYSEFRTLLVMLRLYIELYVAFDALDESGDHRIEYSEFCTGLEKLKTWGVQILDPKAEFQEIDKNGGGYILFDEFCDWALRKDLDYDPSVAADHDGVSNIDLLKIREESEKKEKRSPKMHYVLSKNAKKIARQCITNIYKKHNPSKFDSVPSLLKKYTNQEATFLRKLVRKYAIPQKEIPNVLRKYTQTVKRKKKEIKMTPTLIMQQLDQLKMSHLDVKSTLNARNLRLQQEMKWQMDEMNKLVKTQQAEIDRLYKFIEKFLPGTNDMAKCGELIYE